MVDGVSTVDFCNVLGALSVAADRAVFDFVGRSSDTLNSPSASVTRIYGKICHGVISRRPL